LAVIGRDDDARARRETVGKRAASFDVKQRGVHRGGMHPVRVLGLIDKRHVDVAVRRPCGVFDTLEDVERRERGVSYGCGSSRR